MRADSRSDIFSLGAVLFETLTLRRLFDGKTTAQVLEQVVAGHLPSPRTLNPDIPDGVMSILRAALQRDPSRRFDSAGEMGEACEHYLYDKGYGPTNLTLKHHLPALFPPAAAAAGAAAQPVEPTLRPGERDARRTPVSPVAVTFTRVVAGGRTLGATSRARRMKPRARPR